MLAFTYRSVPTAALAAFILIAAALPLSAQVTGRITGFVKDPAGGGYSFGECYRADD